MARLKRGKAQEIADQINVNLPCDEKVFIEAVRKGGDDYRLTCCYGELAQARQQLVVDMLRYREGLPHEQTVMNGGIAVAIKRTNKNFAAGFRYSAELDIRRCFQSFRTGNLARLLRLPESVVEHVIRINNLVPVPSRTCRTDVLHHLPNDPETLAELFEAILGSQWEQARLGLPEGSKLSPIVTEILLSPIVRRLTASRLGRVLEGLRRPVKVKVQFGGEGVFRAGGRNSELTKIGGSLRFRGLSETAIGAALRAINTTTCNPPLDVDEVDRIASSIGRYESASEAAFGWLDDVEESEPQFLAFPYIVKGALTVLDGNMGQGKSTFTCAIAAAVTTGKPS